MTSVANRPSGTRRGANTPSCAAADVVVVDGMADSAGGVEMMVAGSLAAGVESIGAASAGGVAMVVAGSLAADVESIGAAMGKVVAAWST